MTNYYVYDFSQSFQPPLVLPRRGEAGYFCFVKDFFCQSLQPPLVLPRRGEAGYSDLSKTGGYRLLRFVKDWESPVFPFCKFTFFLATTEKIYVT